MNLVASGTLDMGARFQYLCTLVNGETLHQFDPLSSDVESMETLNMEYIIKVLALYSPPVNHLLKQKCVIGHIMNKLLGIKIRHNAARFIE